MAEYPRSTLTLPNGLGVVLEQSADVGAASLVLVVGVGSADEGAAQAGLAHLVEHLVFHNHAAGELELSKRLTLQGGAWNAWTGWDTTTFASEGPAAAIGPLLGLMASVLEHSLLGVGRNEFAHELAIVENERRPIGFPAFH